MPHGTGARLHSYYGSIHATNHGRGQRGVPGLDASLEPLYERSGSNTQAGHFGARAARLTAYLDASHHNVELTDEERRRVIVWLDANSDFYGAYEHTAAQSRGEIVHPSLD